IEEVHERMYEIYEVREKEDIDKDYIESKGPSYEQSLKAITTDFEETKREVQDLKKMYYFDDHDMDHYLSLEKAISKRKDEFKQIMSELEGKSTSNTELRNQ